MGNRLSKITTRTGDDGTTGLGDGSRVDKDSLRIHAIGEVDELNSHLGLLLCEALPDGVRTALIDIQNDLFDLGGELCLPGQALIQPAQVLKLDEWLAHYNADLPRLKEFILPGGNRAAASAHVARTQARRAERAPNPDSLDLYFQGMALLNKGNTPDYLVQVRGYFDRALALDPGNIEASVWGAYVDTLSASLYATDDRAARLTGAEAALTAALSLAPDHSGAHLFLGLVQIQTNRAAQGMASCERALALDRNLAPAHAMIGLAKYRIGRSEETEAHIEEALRLSPRDTFGAAWLSISGDAKLFLGSDEEAVTRFNGALALNRNNPYANFLLSAALAHLGRLDEARAAVRAGLALNREFTVRRYLAGAASDNPTFLAQRERVVAGLRKAGVPEG